MPLAETVFPLLFNIKSILCVFIRCLNISVYTCDTVWDLSIDNVAYKINCEIVHLLRNDMNASQHLCRSKCIYQLKYSWKILYCVSFTGIEIELLYF